MRPTISRGSSGPHVETLQQCVAVDVDGDFGQNTEHATMAYQAQSDLDVDGIVGPATWAALENEFSLPPWPQPMAPALDDDMQNQIVALAQRSPIAGYSWKDRGQAPAGYSNGMAVAYGFVVRKFLMEDSTAGEMAKADTRDDGADALSYYSDVFDSLGMDNSRDGLDTLRHLFVLLWGLGMRESSGQHCCGRDQSASNVTADTCEAGLFQTSWNIRNFSPDEMQKLFDQFTHCSIEQTGIRIFKEDVSCSASNWECYGDGDGFQYQVMAKAKPQFAAETTALGLRVARAHWGPIGRLEAEVRPEADELLRRVEEIVTGADEPVA